MMRLSSHQTLVTELIQLTGLTQNQLKTVKWVDAVKRGTNKSTAQTSCNAGNIVKAVAKMGGAENHICPLATALHGRFLATNSAWQRCRVGISNRQRPQSRKILEQQQQQRAVSPGTPGVGFHLLVTLFSMLHAQTIRPLSFCF